MNEQLEGARVAILAGSGVEESSVLGPWTSLQDAGVRPAVVSRHCGQLATRRGGLPGSPIVVDAGLHSLGARRFDGLMIVGDYPSTERLRADPAAARFVRGFFDAGKPVAALEHGASLVLEARQLAGRNLTCAASLKLDVQQAGARWHDRAFVRDGNLLTGRGRADAVRLSRGLVEALRRQRGADRSWRRLRAAGRGFGSWWTKLKPGSGWIRQVMP